MLERSVKAGEDLDPFHTSLSGMARVIAKCEVTPKRPSKTKKPSKSDGQRSKSVTPHATDEDDGKYATESPQDVTDSDLDLLVKSLELARDSLLATDCCLTLLSSDRLQKQVCTTYVTAQMSSNVTRSFILRNS